MNSKNSWIIGFFASLTVAVLLSNLFMDSLYSHVYEPSLKKYVYAPNTAYLKRQEGWATTFIGMYNTYAIPSIEANMSAKVAIWGDSEVEAFQTPDDDKMAQQATNVFRARGVNLLAFAVGHSNNSFADYYFDIPKYEQVIPNISSHYIIMCSIGDALPISGISTTTDATTKNDGGRARYYSNKNNFVLKDSDCRPAQQTILYYLAKYKLRIELVQ